MRCRTSNHDRNEAATATENENENENNLTNHRFSQGEKKVHEIWTHMLCQHN